MKKIINYLLVVSFVGILIACTKDFIVKDIKNDTVTIIAPVDNLNTPNNTITFWWDQLDGAEKYNLQIVKPSFDSITQLIIDTNVTINKFIQVLTPGKYQWRIKAINGGGSTAYITRTLIIDSTSNLGLVSVGLSLPINNLVLNNNNVNFSWNSLPNVDYYELKLTNTLTNSITTISNITGTSYSYSFTTTAGIEESFTWQVRAFNSTTQTTSNLLWTFKIDHKSPFLPSIISPNSYSISVRDTNYLIWNRNSSSADIKYDIVSISSDSLFNSSLGITTSFTTTSPIRINSIYSYTGTPIPVWWRVSSVDSVGNTSNNTLSKRLYLN
jgi:hypothetical protein